MPTAAARIALLSAPLALMLGHAVTLRGIPAHWPDAAHDACRTASAIVLTLANNWADLVAMLLA